MTIRELNAITLVTRDMAAAVAFYETLGFSLEFGGSEAGFTTFRIENGQALNLISDPAAAAGMTWWGRAIFHVDDVDRHHARACDGGLEPETEPENASWGERFYHITDPDGHALSFAKPL